MGSEATEVDRKEEEEKRGTKREKDEEEDELGEEGSKSKRPSRERKKVEKYSAVSPRKISASKALSIEEGSGTKLRDIPNVVYKLSKRKADDSLQALHTILFGKKSNVHFLKRNILQFSGFVWTENEEKHKAKLKEKLDKYTKEKLIDFCGLLDIQFPKSTTKKEDVSAKLLEFLESPHVTRDLLLADKDKKGKKRRSRTKAVQEATEDPSSDKETKKRKKSTEVKVRKGQKQSPKTEEDEIEVSVGRGGAKDALYGEEDKNDLEEESDHDNLEEEEEKESEEPLESTRNGTTDEIQPEDVADQEDKGRASPTKKTDSVKSNKSPSKHVSKKTAPSIEDETDVATDSKHGSTKEQRGKSSKAVTKEKVPSVKKEEKKKSSRKNATEDANDPGPSRSSKSQKEDKKKGMSKEEVVVEGKKARKKKEAKPAAKVSTKGQGKRKENAGPSTEELHSVVSTILKEVDFNTATMADILKQLGSHFKMDLMDRKAEVKSIIEDVINNMTDDDDDAENEDNLGGNEEENKSEEESD